MKTYVEAATPTLPAASLGWDYDANGNIRRSTASYVTLDGNGAASAPVASDYWFRYDAMNRLVTDRGTIVYPAGNVVDGQIVRGAAGQDIQYDAAGQRVGVLRTETYDYYQAYAYETRESYGYDAGGRLAEIRQSTGQVVAGTAPPPAPAGGTLRSGFYYDLLGHQTQQTDYAYGSVVYSRSATYGLDGRITNESVSSVKTDNATYTTSTGYYYGSGASWALGNVVSLSTYNTRNYQFQSSGTTTNGYLYRDGAVQSSIQYQPNSGAGGFTSFVYDALGTLRSAQVSDGRSRTVGFVSDIDGQVIARDEADIRYQQGDPHERWYRFNGRQLGYTGNNGTDDLNAAGSIADRQVLGATTPGAFRNAQTTGSSYTDFAQSYDPLNSFQQGSQAGGYTVRGGESLQGIAQNLWGDAGLWYKLAEANGLTASSALPAGMTLRLPAGIVRTTHNAGTLTPYDPSDAIGDVSPTTPQPNKPKKNKCGTFGVILLAAIAIAVVAIAGPALIGSAAVFGTGGAVTTAATGLTAAFGGAAAAAGSAAAIGAGIVGGALAGALGSVISQGVGVATGIQSKFSWKGVALAAIGGGVTGGLSGAGILSGASGLTGAVQDVARGALSNAVTQGVSVATGLQRKFDWAGVAVGGVVGGVIGQTNIGGFGGRITSGVAGALAGAATRTLLNGSDFGDNVLVALPDVIGSTIGESLASGLSGTGRAGRASSTDGDTIIAQAAYDRGAAAYPRNVAFIDGPQDDGYIQSDIIVTATQGAIDEARGFFSWAWNGLKSAANSLFHGSSRNAYQRDALVAQIAKAPVLRPDVANAIRHIDSYRSDPRNRAALAKLERDQIATNARVEAASNQLTRQVLLGGLTAVTGGASGAVVTIAVGAAGLTGSAATGATIVGDGLAAGVTGIPGRASSGGANTFGTFATDTEYGLAGSILGRAVIAGGGRLVGRIGGGGVAAERELPTIAFSKTATPGIASNIESALADGQPSVLTRLTGKDVIRANRSAALRGQAKPASTHSLDEYPFASSGQGGAGARVAPVPRIEQNIQGGQLSSFYQINGIKHGDPFRVIVVP